MKKVDLRDNYAKKRGGVGRPNKMLAAVNEYQRRLGLTYQEWADLAAGQLEDVPEDKREETILALILLLRQMFQADGRRYITDGMHIGLGSMLPTPEIDQRLQIRLVENDEYIRTSLIPDVEARVRKAITSEEIIGAAAIATSLMALQARTELYAGSMWAMMQDAIGERSKQQEDNRVRWVLEPLADHCEDCPRFAGEYESYDAMLAATGGAIPGSGVQCNGNCRCSLEFRQNGQWVRL